MTGVAVAKRPRESWRQRFVRSLLYGRNVDRNAKARARVGLAILAFAAVYAVIGGRLVMFAMGADSHSARRAASSTRTKPSSCSRARCPISTKARCASA